MKRKLFLIPCLVLLLACASGASKSKPTPSETPDASGFCGSSTKGPCKSDSDCMQGGCSAQICQSKSEEPAISTCEFRECYQHQKFGLSCGCVSQTCQWH